MNWIKKNLEKSILIFNFFILKPLNTYRKNLQNLNRYLKKNNIDFETQMEVKKYMNFLWKIEEMQTTEKESETYGKILLQIPLFNKNFSKNFLKRVLSLMKPVYYDPNSIIYQVNNYFNIEIYEKG